MRVLQVINGRQQGGAGALLAQLTPRLRLEGIETEVHALGRSESFLEAALAKSGIALTHASCPRLYSPAQAGGLARRLRGGEYDLIHVHLFPAQLWTALGVLLAGRRIPLVTTEHNTYNRRRRPLFRPLDRWMYGRYAAIACISDATALSLMTWLPELRSRVSTIHNGILLEQFREASALDRREVAGGGRPLLLFAARFEAQKDHPTLLRALRRLPSVHLALAGDGATRPGVEQLARSLGLADRVCFLGERGDVPRLLKTADIYVQSSYWEGFGLAALEAMAAGLPVVASRVPGLAELVGDAGLLFEPGDDRELADQIGNLLASPQLRSDLIARGAERARQFSIEDCARRYAALYRQVAAGGRV